MIKDYSQDVLGKQKVSGRSMQLGSAGFLTKGVGIIITGTAICVICCSMIMGWMIQDGLNELSVKKETKSELLKVKEQLDSQKERLLAQANVSEVAGGLGLYPASHSQVKQL